MGWQTPERWLWWPRSAPPTRILRIALAYQGINAELARLPWEWP